MSADTNGNNQSTSANANPGTEQGATPEQQPDVETKHAMPPQPPVDEAGQDSTKPEAARAYVDPSIAAEARIAELEAQVAEMRDRYVRAYAETENVRKRAEREKADVSKYAVTGFAQDMVAIGDNLSRAVEAAGGSSEEQSPQMKALLDGVVLTDQELKKALEKHGVRGIAAQGEQFDPHKHQAVMEQEDASVSSGTVLQVFQEGYEIGDRVLRPSMVVVSKGGAKPIKSSDAKPPLEADPANDAAGETVDSGEQDEAAPEPPGSGSSA